MFAWELWESLFVAMLCCWLGLARRHATRADADWLAFKERV